MKTFNKLFKFEKKYKESKRVDFIAGVDEVGRGSLAGPVVSCVLLLKPSFFVQIKKHKIKIADSKLLTPKERETAYKFLKDYSFYGVGFSSNLEIDKFNIHKSTLLSMKRALKNFFLKIKNSDFFEKTHKKNIGFVFDGRFIPDPLKDFFKNFTFEALVDSDFNFLSVAASSIVAKVIRDEFMKKLSLKLSSYDFLNNKGYGTPKHIRAIKEFGPSSYHRKTFLRLILENKSEKTLKEETLFNDIQEADVGFRLT